MGSKIPSCVFWMNVGLNSKKCRELHSLSSFHTITKRSILSKPSITQIIGYNWNTGKSAKIRPRHLGDTKKGRWLSWIDYLRLPSTNDIAAKRKIHYQPLMIYLIRWRNVFWYRLSTGRSTTFLQCILSSTNISVIIGKYTGVIQLSLKVQKSGGS